MNSVPESPSDFAIRKATGWKDSHQAYDMIRLCHQFIDAQERQKTVSKSYHLEKHILEIVSLRYIHVSCIAPALDLLGIKHKGLYAAISYPWIWPSPERFRDISQYGAHPNYGDRTGYRLGDYFHACEDGTPLPSCVMITPLSQ